MVLKSIAMPGSLHVPGSYPGKGTYLHLLFPGSEILKKLDYRVFSDRLGGGTGRKKKTSTVDFEFRERAGVCHPNFSNKEQLEGYASSFQSSPVENSARDV